MRRFCEIWEGWVKYRGAVGSAANTRLCEVNKAVCGMSGIVSRLYEV